MYVQFGITFQHICHVLGKHQIGLEYIYPKYNYRCKKYVLVEHEDELTKLCLNFSLSEKCVPRFYTEN